MNPGQQVPREPEAVYEASAGDRPGNARALPGLLLTRPSAQSETLAKKIRAIGGIAWIYPTLHIEPLVIPSTVVCSTLRLSHWWIFISANAVLHGWPLVAPYVHAEIHLAAVGQTTATRLQQCSGLPVLFPSTGSDSEALLALPALASLHHQKIVIVRGKGGREWLKSILESRQAEVHYLECYERQRPVADLSLLDDALAGPLAVSIQSAEALDNLWQMAGPERQACLRQKWFIASHPRVAQAALKYDIHRVQVTDPGDDALVECWKNLSHSRNI